jgi:hypothetical protein
MAPESVIASAGVAAVLCIGIAALATRVIVRSAFLLFAVVATAALLAYWMD